MNLQNIKLMGKTSSWLAKLPLRLMTASGNIDAREDRSSWKEEKTDIIERANWLCEEIIIDPKRLVNKMPTVLGEELQGQWAIYCCSMLAHALANISNLYPDKASRCQELIAKLINIVTTNEIRKYDTIMWKEDAMESLPGKKSHMTYLSILAWMISNYKLIGGDNRFDSIFSACCSTLNRRMIESKYDLNLLSFLGKQIFIPDMLVAIIALKNYARLNNGTYQDTVEMWINNAKTKWIHKGTGLLAGILPGASRYQKGIVIRGSYSALNCSYLSLVDEDFAKEQAELLKKHLTKEASIFGVTLFGVKEYLKKEPKFAFKAGDAGLVIEGLSAGGTAFALGSSTYFEDWVLRYKFLRTAELAGETILKDGKRHYKMGEIFMVGEATVLAMRTNITR